MARLGLDRQTRIGQARCPVARRGLARQTRRGRGGLEWTGKSRHGRADKAWTGGARQGLARNGTAFNAACR